MNTDPSTHSTDRRLQIPRLDATTADIYRARRTTRKYVLQTPLTRSEWLSEKYDSDVYLKREGYATDRLV